MRERFLCCIDVHDVTGAGLATTILKTLTLHGLNVEHLREQGYDGISEMSGTLSGCQAAIKTPVQLHSTLF